jgi:ribosomal protein S3
VRRIAQSGAMTVLYPASEFADVVAIILEAAHGQEADLSEVRIVRSERRPYVYFKTRTPQAFLGPKRERSRELQLALAEKLGVELELHIGRPPPERQAPQLPHCFAVPGKLFRWVNLWI